MNTAPMAPMTPEYVNDVRNTIRGLICEHMPTTAISSGMVSANPLSPALLTELAEAYEATGRECRLSYVMEWLAARGGGGKSVARAVREEVILRDLRRGSREVEVVTNS